MPEEAEETVFSDEPPTIEQAEEQLKKYELESSSGKTASIPETDETSDAPNESPEEDILTDEECINMTPKEYEKLNDKQKARFGI